MSRGRRNANLQGVETGCGKYLIFSTSGPKTGRTATRAYAPWHFLYFLPLPQGQGSLRPVFWPVTTGVPPRESSPPTNCNCSISRSFLRWMLRVKSDAVHHGGEEFVGSLLVFDQRVLLPIRAVADALLQLVHRQQVVLPLVVDHLQHHDALGLPHHIAAHHVFF